MTVTLPIAASSAAASTAPPPTPAASMPERQIFEYAMEAQQAVGNNGGQLANPSALVGELVEHLRPFLEREQRVSKFIHGGIQTSHAGLLSADASSPGEPGLPQHGGPAQAGLEPVGHDIDRVASDQTGDRFDLMANRIAHEVFEQMFNVAVYNLQAMLIERGSQGVVTSVNTLLRGS
jgi:hypothetical protein